MGFLHHGVNVTTPKINSLNEVYRKSLPEKAIVVSTAWKTAVSNSFSEDSMSELQSIFHKLAGSAGMYGYTELASQASEIEQSIIIELEKSSSDNRPGQKWCDSTGESIASFVQSLHAQFEQGVK